MGAMRRRQALGSAVEIFCAVRRFCAFFLLATPALRAASLSYDGHQFNNA
jgi:hypothetical protein